jgi:hypothetical protein
MTKTPHTTSHIQQTYTHSHFHTHIHTHTPHKHRQAWRDVEVVEIEGGHCVHDEDPARTSEAIRQFVWRVMKGGERDGGVGGGGGEKGKTTEGVAVVGAA